MSINTDKTGGAQDLTTRLAAGYAIPRVNLLPPEITAARTFRRTQVGLGTCVLLVVGAITGVFLHSLATVGDSADSLAAEQSRTSTLQGQQAEFGQVPVVLAQLEAAETARATAMGSDVLWYRYLNDIATTYPENVWLGGLTATASSAAAPAVPSTDPLATPGIGTISFTGSALSNQDVASWLDVLTETGGFADASMSDATRTERAGQTVVDFTTGVVLTDDALSHRYDRKAS